MQVFWWQVWSDRRFTWYAKSLLQSVEQKQNGIFDNLLSVLYDFIKDKKQRVTLNGQASSWSGVHVGVPQGSILGALIFLVYINDLSDHLSSNAKLFADNTFLF